MTSYGDKPLRYADLFSILRGWRYTGFRSPRWKDHSMQIAKSTDYALRALIYAASKQGQLVTQQEVADFFDISRDHLRKIVHELARNGYLTTHRGVKGGFELARPPARINVGDIMELFEPKAPMIDCTGMACVLTADCLLKQVFRQAEKDFRATVGRYTLADILNPPIQRLINA